MFSLQNAVVVITCGLLNTLLLSYYDFYQLTQLIFIFCNDDDDHAMQYGLLGFLQACLSVDWTKATGTLQ